MTKQKLFCLYMGAEFINGQGQQWTICGVVDNDVYDSTLGETDKYPIADCTALLYDLSDITDEDAVEVAKLANMDVADQDSLTDVQVVSKNEFGVIEVMCWEKISTERDEWDVYPFYIDTTGEDFIFYDHMGSTSNPVKVIDYLRLHHYCTNESYYLNGWAKRRVRG